MFSTYRGTSTITCNSVVSETTITNSDIDMNSKVITNAGTPVNNTDVVNKLYVDTHVSAGLAISTVNLIGVSYSSILPITFGSLSITITPTIENAPSAVFSISKSSASRNPSYTRLNSSSGSISNERLNLIWNINDYPKLGKDGNNYDGIYTVSIMKM